jgi:putative intracellular protease/amidase
VQTDRHIDDPAQAFDLLLVPGGPGAYNEKHPARLPGCNARWGSPVATVRSAPGRLCSGMPVCSTVIA